MFGLKTNQQKCQPYLLPGENFAYFVDLGVSYLGITNKKRVFAHEIEKESVLEGTLHIFDLNQITGVILYRKKAAVYAGAGVGLMLGAKEIILLSSKKASEDVVMELQKYVWNT